MIKIYGDNSSFYSRNGTDVEDVQVFGGIIINGDEEREFLTKVAAIKRRYCGDPRVPIKYNFKDLKTTYNKANCQEYYQQMISTSRDWRRDIFALLNETECRILVSVIQSHESQKHRIIQRRAQLNSYLFGNFLMRCGLDVRPQFNRDRSLETQLILDWPEGNDPSVFNQEYAAAYNLGETTEGQDYDSGPLRRIGFNDSVMFANMHHTVMLQIADLVVGSCKEFLQHCIGHTHFTFGLELLRISKGKIRGYRSNVLNRGVIVSSGNQTLRNAIIAGLPLILDEPQQA